MTPELRQQIVEKAAVIDGWMAYAQLNTLIDLASSCEVFIELGSYHGRSTKAISMACPGLIIAVEHFMGAPDISWMTDPQEHENIFRTNLNEELQIGKLRLLSMDGEVAANLLKTEGVLADCIFIDAAHTYEAVKRDIENYIGLVKPGGLLTGHDYGVPGEPGTCWSGVVQAVNEAFPNVEAVNGIWIHRVLQ
jgi:predicted O-methyltransferase YrrM